METNSQLGGARSAHSSVMGLSLRDATWVRQGFPSPFLYARESEVIVPTLMAPVFLIYGCWDATGRGVFSHEGLLQGGGLSTLKDQRRQVLGKVGYSRPIGGV